MTSAPGGGDRTAAPAAEPFVQRLADGKAGARVGPGSDPKFTALKRDVRSKQQTLGKHPPAKTEANAAQGAAKAPPDDKEAQGKTANAEKMNAAKPGEFDKAAFVKAVNEAIKKQAPQNLDEADKFGDSGKADAVKGEVQGKVGKGKESSADAIETTTKAPPDTAAAKEKQVTPLRPDQPPPKPGAPDPSQAVPDKAPPAATDFSAGPKQVDQQMADAQVTEEQLAKSNEPEFTGALKEKKAGEAHASTAPGQVRAAESKTLAGAKEQAAQAGATAMTTMAGDRTKAGQDVGAGKEGAKSEDEKKREQVTAKLQKVFDATKKDVEDILNGLDKKVDDKFDAGEKAARDAFTAEYTRKMDAYKDKRYSGLMGKGRWVKDLFADLPSEVNVFYEQARENYVNRMQGVISDVADVIGAELGRAKQRIAKGRDDLQAEVKKLPADLQAIGKEAAGEFAGKFDELTQSVDDKGTQLVDTLASKYTEALKAVDEEIAAEKEKNKGLVSKAVDAVKGAIDTILKLKDLLLGVLAKAAQAVMAIIKDPIGFLGKLVSGVGAGLKAFMANIAAHLQKGLVSWLLGAAAKAGLQLPEKFDIKGILMLIGSLLGLTWGAIRGRVVAKGVPEQAMGAVESSVPMAQKIQSEGIGGVWEQLKEKVGDLKGTLLAKIAQYLIPTVIIAGITWIISLLNPASAFIKACKAIIDIVMFIIERGAQIIAFVNAVLDAVIAIAGGGAG
ncbi:MAG: phage tail protein, partial [Pseudonocardiaceae bacterium]